jgi:general secretion pathway protein J
MATNSSTCASSQALVRPGQAGFTLIEVLVVLILVAMVSGILFQALERAYRLQNRFGSELFKVQQGQMAADWYRQAVQGLYPDQPEGQNIFRGKSQEFSGLSSNPLGDSYGTPTPITWKIREGQEDGTTELVYGEEKKETPVLIWRTSQARFKYMDAVQASHDSWPPPLGLFPQLPTQIQLVTSNLNEPINLVSSPMGPVEPLFRPQDLFGIKP